jgi:hypothetical protein
MGGDFSDRVLLHLAKGLTELAQPDNRSVTTSMGSEPITSGVINCLALRTHWWGRRPNAPRVFRRVTNGRAARRAARQPCNVRKSRRC